MFFKSLINTVMVILKLALNKAKQNPDSRSEIRTFLKQIRSL